MPIHIQRVPLRKEVTEYLQPPSSEGHQKCDSEWQRQSDRERNRELCRLAAQLGREERARKLAEHRAASEVEARQSAEAKSREVERLLKLQKRETEMLKREAERVAEWGRAREARLGHQPGGLGADRGGSS